eukprot:GHVQ01023652.1.p1 GENE.GHVQ01023652.1~~GHVQ01023652.1.p1  ORF type:complete len:663 (+),score=65.64 GHVQ01023652.1:365-2353(+)
MTLSVTLSRLRQALRTACPPLWKIHHSGGITAAVFSDEEADSRTRNAHRWTRAGLTLALLPHLLWWDQQRQRSETRASCADSWTCSIGRGRRYVAHCDGPPSKVDSLSSPASPTVTSQEGPIGAQQKREWLPNYSLNDVASHAIGETGIWVYYKNGVYDITEFINKHPGGKERIILAAGGSLEPFWAMYTVHKHPQIYEMLEDLRIGNFEPTEEELEKMQQRTEIADLQDPYRYEPMRHPALRVVSQKPFNAESPVALLADNFLTPSELFFVRNHLPVPKVDPEAYRLSISGLGLKGPVELTVEDLKKFPKHSVDVTIQCAGNRRSSFQPFKPVKGLDWQHGAIGTATWGGARLRDIFAYCGVTQESVGDLGIEHVHFEGLDQDPSAQPYAASIPIDKAIHRDGDVILAYEMNGAPLPIDHGYPLRAIVPGVVGARNVKWLNRVVLSDDESQSFWQQNDYRVFSPSVDWEHVNWRRAPSIQEYPVQSGICEPRDGTALSDDDEDLTVRGYAWSGGGRAIIRVDVSIDGGRNWHEARLRCRDKRCHERTDAAHGGKGQAGQDMSGLSGPDDDDYEDVDDWHHRRVDKAWAWVLWTVDIRVPPELKNQKLEICSRAVDASYNTQPESAGPIWNLRGCLCNSWHRVTVNIGHESKACTPLPKREQ